MFACCRNRRCRRPSTSTVLFRIARLYHAVGLPSSPWRVLTANSLPIIDQASSFKSKPSSTLRLIARSVPNHALSCDALVHICRTPSTSSESSRGTLAALERSVLHFLGCAATTWDFEAIFTSWLVDFLLSPCQCHTPCDALPL